MDNTKENIVRTPKVTIPWLAEPHGKEVDIEISDRLGDTGRLDGRECACRHTDQDEHRAANHQRGRRPFHSWFRDTDCWRNCLQRLYGFHHALLSCPDIGRGQLHHNHEGDL